MSTAISDQSQLRRHVDEAVAKTPVLDVHTHLSTPNFGGICLWGIDELVNYHYLTAELFRSSPVKPEQYWALSKQQQADLIWDTLFVKNTPLSEACRGVVNVMTAFGLDPSASDLTEARRYFRAQKAEEHVERTLDVANVSELVMTNDPFDPAEAAVWKSDPARNPRFHAALRLDPLINWWSDNYGRVQAEGFDVTAELSPRTIGEARRFLDTWIARMKPLYMAVSLPHDFTYGEDSPRTKILREVVLATARAHKLPFAMMIGVARRVNPALRDAGDSVGHAGIRHVERIAVENPDVRFLVTMLSRENQHELCVTARKFGNILVFGCWWFLNNPSIVTEITSERLELLGASFVPQHSDARILEQVIYKWAHSRRVIANCLFDSYAHLLLDGYPLTRQHIDRDVKRMFSGNFRNWVGLDKAQGSTAV